MHPRVLGRLALSFAAPLALLASLVVVLSAPRPAAAAPACGASSAGGATRSGPAPTQAGVGAIPTEAAISPEVNPPGDIPDNQAFVAFRSSAGGYGLAVPEGWARQESGTSATFVNKLDQISVEIGCAKTTPTVADAKTGIVPQLAKRQAAFKLVAVKAVALPAGQAVLIQYQANSAPDAVTGKQVRLQVDRYEVFNAGKLAALSLAAPAGSDNVDVWRQISESFRWR